MCQKPNTHTQTTSVTVEIAAKPYSIIYSVNNHTVNFRTNKTSTANLNKTRTPTDSMENLNVEKLRLNKSEFQLNK